MKQFIRNATVLGASLLAGIALVSPMTADAQINYQGRLTDGVGAPLTDGQYVIEFSLWTDGTGGTQTWGPYILDGTTDLGHGPLADLVNSRFNVIIGNLDTANRSLTTSMTDSPTAYLQIKVGNDDPISPRQIILPAPRALSADVLPNVTPNASGVDITGDVNVDGHATVVSNLTVAASFSAGQISTGGRVMPSSIEFWTGSPNPLKGGLFRQGGTGSWLGSTSAADGDMVLSANAGKLHLQHDAGVSAITIDTANRVGVGTSTPTQAKLVVNGSVSGAAAGDGGFAFNIGGVGITGTGVNKIDDTLDDVGLYPFSGDLGSFPRPATSIYATHAIWSGTALVSSSDERIKIIQGRSDSAEDLDTLRDIEVTDYQYKDVIGKGNALQKKVVAQQVEKVYPQAVSEQTDSVPDIYQRATIKDGWIALATDLKKGDRVKLISKDVEEIHEVLEVTEDTFRTDFKTDSEKVFVYGREVNDFRTVDYDAISMLNVSATQELARRLETQEVQLAAKNTELAQLRKKNDNLTQTLIDLEARLTRLERSSPDVQLTGLKGPLNKTK